MSEKVQVIIFRQNEGGLEVLLLQTNKQRGLFWQNVTGGVESFDKTLVQAACREVLEETGVYTKSPDIKSLNFSYEYHDSQRSINYTEHIFYVVLPDSAEICISPEHNAYCWKPINRVTKLDYNYSSNYEGFNLAIRLHEESK